MKTPSTYQLQVFETEAALQTALTQFIVKLAAEAIAIRGQFVISLSGGQTPQKLYALLASVPFKGQLDWNNTHIFWGDERCVPLNDERNNAHQARTLLIDKITIPPANIHIIPVNMPPREAARMYEKEIRQFFGAASPQFDLVLLGLGENGHTASLFPDTLVLQEQEMGIREVYVKEEKIFRITMTASLINGARNVVFMVTGKNKAQILKQILYGSYHPLKYPAQLINPEKGKLYWFVDEAAANIDLSEERILP